ncbi:MAG: hypothetical protein FJX35_19035 [Alphaproteobacteria bacterium]|nr:hypothetical protein [Alphaproteobacteria bacterium]
MTQRGYDPDRAKFHYAKTGHSGPIVLNTSETVYAGAIDAALIFQASAAKAGITINVNRVPADGYYINVWQKVPFCMVFYGGRPTADLMFATSYASNAAWNDTHWRRPKFDELLLAARSELDRAKRKQMYGDMQRMIHEDGGAIIPIFNNFIDAGVATLRGFVPTPTRQMSGFRAAEKVWFAA